MFYKTRPVLKTDPGTMLPRWVPGSLSHRKQSHQLFLKQVETTTNSYLWILRQFDSYKLRAKILKKFSPGLKKFFTFYWNKKILITKFSKWENLSINRRLQPFTKNFSRKKIHHKTIKLSATIPWWKSHKKTTCFIETKGKKYFLTTEVSKN